MIKPELIKAYTLDNAIMHEGKANIKAVLSKLFKYGLKKNEVKAVIPLINEDLEQINSMSLEQQKQEFRKYNSMVKHERKQREGLPELHNVKGEVIMRLAPFPSGPLHIGNARPYIINDYYVKRYGGTLFLVIDDTIGSKDKQIAPESYDMIPEGLKWLDIKFREPIVYKSDRLDIYYKHAEELIEKGKAYVCFCSVEKIRENRAKGIECSCRSKGIDQNLKEWHEMLDGKYDEGKAVLRLKTNMKHPNPAFRDRILFRISKRKHPRVGTKYSVWPMMEFSWTIDDHLLGITHIVRGKELMIETDMEKYIFDIFGWPHPEFIHTGLLQIEGVKLSKSKGQQEIKSGRYFGWNDPRTWSLQSLKLRGIMPQAIRKFVLSFGLTQTEVKVPVQMLYQYNKKYIESSPRYFFIEKPIKITINNAPELAAKLPLHPNQDFGFRKMKTSSEFYISFSDYQNIRKAKPDSVFRFMHLFNFIKKNEHFEFHSIEHNKKFNAKLIHWLPEKESQNLVEAVILMPNAIRVKGLAEPAVSTLQSGAIIQFERFGFCRLNEIKTIKEKNVQPTDMDTELVNLPKQKTRVYEFWFGHR